MSESAETEEKSPAGIGLGIYFFAGPVVVAIAGIGGKIGERLGGGACYWAGCYLAGSVAAGAAGFLFARLFRGHPLYWTLGTLGMLIGGHLTWVTFGGRATEAPLSGSDQFFVFMAALVGISIGLSVAHRIIARRSAESPA